jgi:hypothetical protein
MMHPKSAETLTVDDFMPKYGPEVSEEEQVGQDSLKTKAGAIFARLGGIVRTRVNSR